MIVRCLLSLLLGLLWVVPSLANPAPPPEPAEQPSETISTPPEMRRIEEHFGLVTAGPLVDRLDRVAERVLAACTPEQRAQIRYVRILDDPMINAFAVPDGYIYFFRGLMEQFETDDQCAGVMAHELIHIFHDHHSMISQDAWKWQIGGLLAAVLTKEPALLTAGQVLGLHNILRFSRKAESDADASGLDLMVRAGYEPLGMLEFMSRLEAASKSNPLLEQGYFLTHPYPTERVAAIGDWMRQRGYTVPVQVFKSRLPVAIRPLSPEEGSETIPEGLGLHLGGEWIYTFAGPPDNAALRADQAARQLRAVLEAGALDYDFRIATGEAVRIVSNQGLVLEIAKEDAALASLDTAELARETLLRIRRVLWRHRVKAHM